MRRAAVRREFARQFFHLRDQSQRLALRRQRGLVGGGGDLPRRLPHERLRLRDQVDDLRRRAVLDQLLHGLAGFLFQRGLFAADAPVFLFPLGALRVQVGMGEDEVFLDEPQLRHLQRGEQREGHVPLLADHLADVVAERLDLHELHAGSRFGQLAGVDALGAQIVRDHVEGFHLQLVEVDRGLDRVRPGGLELVRRDGHAQARLSVDGHLQRPCRAGRWRRRPGLAGGLPRRATP